MYDPTDKGGGVIVPSCKGKLRHCGIVALHWVLRPICTLVCGVVKRDKKARGREGGRVVNKEAGQQGSRRRRQEKKILE